MQDSDWQCDRIFGQDQIRPGERRTILVLLLTGLTMVVEILAGLRFGSMALLADGLHMGSHAVAMAVSVFAYYYARHHAGDQRFSFGTGKVNSLAAFASAVLLAAFAAIMIFESINRFIHPVAIQFNYALVVAFLGLIVNGLSMLLLDHDDHDHDEDEHDHHDHNLRSAYLHVLADAVTSLFAIVALLSGKYFGAYWLDPCMGIVGAILIIRWSIGLLQESSLVLLDKQLPATQLTKLREAIELTNQDRISDLHMWRIGPGINAAEFVIHSARPKTPDHYRNSIPRDLHIVHTAIEIHLDKT
ncbi:MAG: Cation diffusion facilitator family transporter [Gammaproteobacteria bacterium]|nr:Cation diffusion facilitator family transporter [Gammaproteobacteria bacterium]